MMATRFADSEQVQVVSNAVLDAYNSELGQKLADKACDMDLFFGNQEWGIQWDYYGWEYDMLTYFLFFLQRGLAYGGIRTSKVHLFHDLPIGSSIPRSGWWWLEHGFYDFPYIGNRFPPTDELHHFQGGRTKKHQFQGDYVGIDKEKIEAVAGAVGSMAARARDWWGDWGCGGCGVRCRRSLKVRPAMYDKFEVWNLGIPPKKHGKHMETWWLTNLTSWFEWGAAHFQTNSIKLSPFWIMNCYINLLSCWGMMLVGDSKQFKHSFSIRCIEWWSDIDYINLYHAFLIDWNILKPPTSMGISRNMECPS